MTGRALGLHEGKIDNVRQLTFRGAGIINGLRMGSMCEVTNGTCGMSDLGLC